MCVRARTNEVDTGSASVCVCETKLLLLSFKFGDRGPRGGEMIGGGRRNQRERNCLLLLRSSQARYTGRYCSAFFLFNSNVCFLIDKNNKNLVNSTPSHALYFSGVALRLLASKRNRKTFAQTVVYKRII